MKINKRIMYNEKQKLAYIEYEKLNQAPLENYFKRISKDEEALGKDVADMDESELRNTLVGLGIRREESRGHLISLLRGYINWARLTGKTTNNSAISQITAASIGVKEIVASQMIKDPNQAEYILSKAIDSGYYNQENRASRDKLVFWLLYVGVTVNELQVLKKKDFDATQKTISCADGKVYQIDDSIFKTIERLWRFCSSMTKIERSGERFGKDVIYINLVDGKYLFNPIATTNNSYGDKLNQNAFIDIIKKIFKGYSESTGEKIAVTPTNINTSGSFYRAYTFEKDNGIISDETLAKYLNKAYNPTSMRKWRIDYEDWKVAFDYM